MYKWRILKFKTRKDAEFILEQRLDVLKYVPTVINKEPYFEMLEYDEELIEEETFNKDRSLL